MLTTTTPYTFPQNIVIAINFEEMHVAILK